MTTNARGFRVSSNQLEKIRSILWRMPYGGNVTISAGDVNSADDLISYLEELSKVLGRP